MMTQLDVGPSAPAPGVGLGRVRRSTDDKVIAGVCGGLGRYFGVDPVWFRLAMVILAIGGGSGVLIYIVAWLIIPAQRRDEVVGEGVTSLGSRGPMIAGVALIGVGFMLLVDVLVPWFDRVMWPMALVAAGLVLLSMGVRRDA